MIIEKKEEEQIKLCFTCKNKDKELNEEPCDTCKKHSNWVFFRDELNETKEVITMTNTYKFNLTDEDKKILINDLNERIKFTEHVRDECEISPTADHESNNHIRSINVFLNQINNNDIMLTDYDAYVIYSELTMNTLKYKNDDAKMKLMNNVIDIVK